MSKQKTLSEAAAEILKGSVSGAPGEPRHSLEGDGSGLGKGQDLGGDTPTKVAEKNPRNATGVNAKEPGPAPLVGQEDKHALKSNNKNIDVDKQDLGTNDTGDELDHVATQSNDEVNGMYEALAQLEDGEVMLVSEEDGIYMDKEGRFYDENGNELELTEDIDSDNEDEEILDDNDDNNNDEVIEEESNEEDGETESVLLFDREAIYENFKTELDADLGSLLDSDDTLSEDLKHKIKTVFEAAVMARVDMMADKLEEAFVESLNEAAEQIKDQLAEKTEDYLSYVAEQWMQDNEIAVEQALKTELTEDFIKGLKDLFTEHYIDIPEDQVNVVEELTEEVASMEERLNEEIARNVELMKENKQYQAAEIFTTACEGLTDVQIDKMRSLAEGLDFSTADDFAKKLEVLRENYFTAASGDLLKEMKKSEENNGLNESVEFEEEKKAKSKSNDAGVATFVSSLDRVSAK